MEIEDNEGGAGEPRVPLRPKRPLSAYMCYARVERPSVIASNPEFSFIEIGKELGRRWSELSDAQKAPFICEAEADKRRYEMELAAVNPSYVPRS